MILQFIRRDPAWRFTPAFAVTAAGAAFFYSSWHPSSLAGVMFGSYIVAVMQVMPHRRATFFEAALPVAGRDLFLARFLSLMALVWLPGAAASATLVLTGNLAKTVSAIALLAVVLTLATIVNLSVRIREFAAPRWLTLGCPACALGAAAVGLTSGHALLVAVVCGVAAIGVGAAAWRSVPEAFQCAPMEVSRARKKTGNAEPSIPWWPIIRSLLPWRAAMIIPLSFFFVATGQWFFGPMYLMMAYSQTRVTTRWTLGLPVSRRAMLAAATVPMLLVLACGTELGMVVGFAREATDLVRQGDDDRVVVNRAFWRRAPGGRTPVIQAPWGETFQPSAAGILGVAFYNPYGVGEKNSRRFEEWQFARATTYIFGRPYTAREVARAKRGALKPITLSSRMEILSLGLVLAIGLFWAWLVEATMWHQLRRLSRRVRHAVTASAVLIPCAGVLGLEILDKGPGSLHLSALEGGVLFVSRHLPENLMLVALAAMIPLAMLGWMVDRQHAAAELCLPEHLRSNSWPR